MDSRFASAPCALFATALLACAVALARPSARDVAPATSSRPAARQTVVSIEGRAFHVNGKPTYGGRTYRGSKVEGLLMNSRMVQGTLDDANPATRRRWEYPGGPWDADRNTREFVAAMPEWRRRGLIGFTLNLQGGSPQGYSKEQPWQTSAFEPNGSLRPAHLARLATILDRADELGMVPILGYFYFGQEPRLNDEAAVIRATENATDWLLAAGHTNVVVEIANECDHRGYREIIQPKRAGELIRLVQSRSKDRVSAPARCLLVSTSFTGGVVPPANVVEVADFLLLHGNGVGDPKRIADMVDRTRRTNGYREQPILFNEDDHFDFDRPRNNLLAAVERYAGWGYFDYRMKGEGFADGFQSVPVDWGINSPRKRGFFELLEKVTGERDRGEAEK